MHHLIRITDVRSLDRAIDRLPTLVPPVLQPRPEHVARAVHRVDRTGPFQRSCLIRALAERAVLELCGHESQLRIGVRPGSEDSIDAHAWVHHDEGLYDRSIGDFEPLSPPEPR